MNSDREKNRKDAEEIANGIRDGDVTAEQRLVSKYHRGIAIIGRSVLADETAVDDLVQETLRVTIERLRVKPLDDPGGLAAYIQATARGILRADRRKSARRRTFSGTDVIAAAPDPKGNTEQRVFEQQQLEIVHASLAALDNPRDRMLLRLFYFEDLESPQICNQLEINQPHLYRLLHRARRRLKKLLVSEGIEPPSS